MGMVGFESGAETGECLVNMKVGVAGDEGFLPVLGSVMEEIGHKV